MSGSPYMPSLGGARMQPQQEEHDFDSTTPGCGEVDIFGLSSQPGQVRYNQEVAAQPVVDINQQPYLNIFNGPALGTAPGYTADASGLYQQTAPNFQPFDVKQRLPSQPPIPTLPLTSTRGSGRNKAPKGRRQMSVREQYGSSVPKFGRPSEAEAKPDNFYETVMCRSPNLDDANASMSGSYHNTRRYSRSPPYSSRMHEEPATLPMEETEMLGALQYLDGSGSPAGPSVQVEITTNIHKNFFKGLQYYTCYRRNYMTINVSYEMMPYYPGVQMYFTPLGSSAALPIYGFSMSISAIVSAHQHQQVEILQHTPKRDKGPITLPQKIPMAPKTKPMHRTPPHLGGYADAGPSSSSRALFANEYGVTSCQTLPTEHTFERIQFKTATANNGERRAGQQCYRLVVEVWADLGPQAPERWVKVAIQKSPEIVVRGRSPGHYQKERRKSQSSGGGPSPHGNHRGDSSGGGSSRRGGSGSGSGSGGGLGGGGGMGDGMGGGGGGSNPGMGDYSQGGMLGGYAPNGYGAQGPYDPRGGMYNAGGGGSMGGSMGGGMGGSMGGSLRPSDLARHDMPYSLEASGSRMFPSAYTGGNMYADHNLYHQQAQTAGVSPTDVYGKPRTDPDLLVLPRPSEPPMRTTGNPLDGRYHNSPSNSVYPLPSLHSGNFVPSS